LLLISLSEIIRTFTTLVSQFENSLGFLN